MIEIYDTTLRDGTQREGISLSCSDKLRIAHKLDELGVVFIEGGWPGSNPKDAEFFDRAQGACSRDEPQPKLSPASSIWAPWNCGWLRTNSGRGLPSGR